MISVNTLRAALIAKFGARKYRITATGEIHAHGTMPNTDVTGWYVFGAVGDEQTTHALGLTA